MPNLILPIWSLYVSSILLLYIVANITSLGGWAHLIEMGAIPARWWAMADARRPLLDCFLTILLLQAREKQQLLHNNSYRLDLLRKCVAIFFSIFP